MFRRVGVSEESGNRLLYCVGTEKLGRSGRAIFKLLFENGVNLFHGSAEFTETPPYQAFFPSIFPKPEGHRAD